MKYKRKDDGTLELDSEGNPILLSDGGEVVDIKQIVSKSKHDRIAGERETYKTQAEDLQKQITDLSAQGESVEDLQKQITDLQDKVAKGAEDTATKLAEKDAEIARVAKDHAIDTTLLSVGVDKAMLKAAKALIDIEKVELSNGQLTGFDAKQFATDYPSLIDSTASVNLGAPPSGAAGDGPVDSIRAGVEAETKE